jgi:NodT family efflux transporter outer membrane factor (OMF) lipoprotein
MSMSARNSSGLPGDPRRPTTGGGMRLYMAALLCALCGCAVGPTFHRPQPPPVNHYSNGSDPAMTASAQGAAQHFNRGAAVAADWWQLFHSRPLDALITEAIAHNPGLDAAQASLRASQHNLRSGYGIFYPAIDAEAGATRERFSAASFGDRAPSSIFNLFTLSASVSYALDVFGGQRRLVEALRAGVDVARANERATYLALAANIVNTVIAGAAYRAEIDATDHLIDLQKEQVRIASVQSEAGTAPYSSVLTLRSQLASYEATIPQLEQKLVQSEDLLAALAGHTPAEWQAPLVRLEDLTLPGELPVSLPSDLVRQRPDILAAEATAHAASANIGVATAALLPNITLSGSVENATNATGNLFSSNGRAWSIGANATAPLFAGGTLWYRRKAAVDDYDQAMALYRQTVLTAFEQVADTLRALDHDAEILLAEDEALSSAAEALHLVQSNYEAGIATYLDVLLADTQYHQAKIADLQAIAVRYQDTVALFAALGGGWWSRAASKDRSNVSSSSALMGLLMIRK